MKGFSRVLSYRDQGCISWLPSLLPGFGLDTFRFIIEIQPAVAQLVRPIDTVTLVVKIGKNRE